MMDRVKNMNKLLYDPKVAYNVINEICESATSGLENYLTIADPDYVMPALLSTKANDDVLITDRIAMMRDCMKLVDHTTETQPLLRQNVITYRCDSAFIIDGCAVKTTEGKLICNFYISDQYLLKYPDGHDEYKFCVCGEGGLRIGIEHMEIERFRGGSWYAEYHGLSCLNRGLFGQYLEALCAIQLQEIWCFEHPGWYNQSGTWLYITSDGEILNRMNVQLQSSTECMTITACHCAEKRVAEEFYMMRELSANATASLIQTVTILASLFTIFSHAGYTPKLALFVCGPRSCLKTSLVTTQAQLVERHTGMHPKYRFEATQAAIDECLPYYKDCCLIVDDLHPTTGVREKRLMENMLSYITRLFGDATQKQRSRRYQKEEAIGAQGLVIMTGEYVAGVSSDLTRRVHVYLDKDSVNRGRLSYYQNRLQIVPEFFWCFLKYEARNINGVIEMIDNRMNLYRERYQDQYSASRYGEIQALLETANDLLINYLGSIGVLEPHRMQVMSDCFHDEVQIIMKNNDESQNTYNPIEQVREALRVFLSQTETIAPVLSNVKAEVYYSEDAVWIRPEKMLSIVKIYAEEQGIASSIENVPYLTEVLRTNGWLVVSVESEKNRYTHKLPSAFKKKENRRFYQILKSIAKL